MVSSSDLLPGEPFGGHQPIVPECLYQWHALAVVWLPSPLRFCHHILENKTNSISSWCFIFHFHYSMLVLIFLPQRWSRWSIWRWPYKSSLSLNCLPMSKRNKLSCYHEGISEISSKIWSWSSFSSMYVSLWVFFPIPMICRHQNSWELIHQTIIDHVLKSRII